MPTPQDRAPHPSGMRQARTTLTAALAAVTLALSGCAVFGADSRAQETPSVSAPAQDAQEGAAVPAGLEDFYGQSLSWEKCEDGMECTRVRVPMNYADPAGGSIELAAIRSRATGNQLGSVLMNPGGPGVSGYDSVRDSLEYLTTRELRESYAVVGFDPRGVKRSAPVKCLSDRELDADRQKSYDLDTDAGLERIRREAKEFADRCARETGPVLGFIDTESSARDLDILRAALGDPRLNYLGFSYGTSLGASYAELFPANVGRLVLDGAIDPALSSEEITLGQARGFERAIRAYLTDCLARSGCPLSGTVDDAAGQLRQLLADVEASPLGAEDGRQVTAVTFVNGFILPLYNQASWPNLTAALTAALRGDPSPILQLADLGASREPDGTYSANTNFAFTAINCLDYPMEAGTEAMREDAKELQAASPTIGRYLAFGAAACEAWAHPPVSKPAPVTAAGAAPILVIGTTGDPATPYEWAESLADQLESGVLVTYEGQGHTAYRAENTCIAGIVDAYFVAGTVPEDGVRC